MDWQRPRLSFTDVSEGDDDGGGVAPSAGSDFFANRFLTQECIKPVRFSKLVLILSLISGVHIKEALIILIFQMVDVRFNQIQLPEGNSSA